MANAYNSKNAIMERALPAFTLNIGGAGLGTDQTLQNNTGGFTPAFMVSFLGAGSFFSLNDQARILQIGLFCNFPSGIVVTTNGPINFLLQLTQDSGLAVDNTTAPIFSFPALNQFLQADGEWLPTYAGNGVNPSYRLVVSRAALSAVTITTRGLDPVYNAAPLQFTLRAIVEHTRPLVAV